MSDHRRIIEKVFDVVQQRIAQAEQLSMQKLEEAERRGRKEAEEARSRHENKLRKLDKKRRRRSRRDSGGSDSSDWRDDIAQRVGLSEAESFDRDRDEDRGDRARRRSHGKESRDRSHRRREGRREERSRNRERDRQRQHARSDKRRSATPEERAYRAARRRVNLRLFFYTHFAVYASILMLLIVTVRSFRVVAIVALSWGIALFLHYFWGIVAPRLREDWIRREVGPRVHQNVSSERQKVEDSHVRNMGDLSASIAHEIRNPITAAKSLVQQMGEDPVSGDNVEYASVALEELDRVERSISHLLKFARDEELRFSEVQLADLVESALATFQSRIDRDEVTVTTQLDTRGEMRGDDDKLRRVLINLVANAFDAMMGAGTQSPALTVMLGDNLAGTEVWVRVTDNGPGIPPEQQRKIFDPFYTTKEEGTGLGLALSKKIVDAHGGTMEVQSSPETGTEFVLSFPKDAQTPETAS